MPAARVIIGMGSNLGDRLTHLRQAVEWLTQGPVPLLSGVRVSSVYESAALLPNHAPKDWDLSFLNAAISGDCDLDPRALLTQLKQCEERAGRTYRGEWAPRELDLDILLFGEVRMEDHALTIPHKELARRDFAVVPMAEIEPDWKWPLHGADQNKRLVEVMRSLGMTCGTHLVKTRHRLAGHE